MKDRASKQKAINLIKWAMNNGWSRKVHKTSFTVFVELEKFRNTGSWGYIFVSFRNHGKRRSVAISSVQQGRTKSRKGLEFARSLVELMSIFEGLKS